MYGPASPRQTQVLLSLGVPGTSYLIHLPDIKMRSDKAIWERRLSQAGYPPELRTQDQRQD
ncbi:MAG: hypothetical protein B6245_15505 [Desulfobacteraceae bacterium 4572_88]|nr:MAG: hypothetical protein B6245_15505 [Desulfobacteraceae bacterium 4572_88]